RDRTVPAEIRRSGMRIGELATRTHVSTRLLRYYEEQGLLAPERGPNGYRDYGDAQVDRVAQIRGLLDAGLPVRIIQQVLPCLDNRCTIRVWAATPEMIATLEQERDGMDARIRCLARNRDAITAYLDSVRGSTPVGSQAAAPC